ncbi:oligosaccharide flippase family protein [Lelliottia amnigena]|uniref:Putative O-antigen transporter n=2 Tax=Lelliottia amnigena TaxID=61646 RepID=A0ABU7UE09_LELAM
MRITKVMKNIASLGAMQVINYLLPIVLMPFLVVSIGIENVGLIATFTAIAAYMQLIIDYGFNLSATREISKKGYDNDVASVVTSAVLNIKLVLSLTFLVISYLSFYFIDTLNVHTDIFMLTIGIMIFQSFFPVWHFQSAEKMQYITVCNSLPKIIAAAMVFYFVKSPDDTWKVQACFFGGSLVSFIFALVILKRNFDFRYGLSLADSILQLKIGYSIFIARFASGLYKNFNILVLGFFAGTSAVGVYSIAERILRSAQMVQNVLGDSLYPSLAKKITGDPGFFKETAKKYKWLVILVYMICAIIIFILSDFIGTLIGKTSANDVSECLKIMSLAFLFGGLNYICAILGMTTCGYAKEFSICVIATGIFNIFCATALTFLYSFYGASIALVLSELFLLCCVLFFSKKTGIL